MPVISLSLFSSSAIHCLPLSFALLSSSTSAEYPLFIIFPSFNEIEGSAIIAEFNNSFKSSNVSNELYHPFSNGAFKPFKTAFIAGSFCNDDFNETKSLALTFLFEILPTILSIS